MIEVWGRDTSSNVQLVMWAIVELGLESRRHDRGHVHGGLDTPEFGAMNPNRLIPVIRDGELTLWESGAILRYLGARHGDGAFWPPDLVRRAQLDQWAEWIKSTFGPAFNSSVFWLMVRSPGGPDPAALAEATGALKPVAAMLDARIGAGPWLGGGDFTFADVMAGHLLYRYYALSFDKAATPALDAYYMRLRERPAFKAHVCVSFEPLRPR